MKIPALIFDFETTTTNKGNPTTPSNTAVVLGIKPQEQEIQHFWMENYNKTELQEMLFKATLLVGANCKFDLHWLRRIGIDFSNCTIWDVQLAQFIIQHQKNPFPSLDQIAEYWNTTKKKSYLVEEFWDEGVDTLEIPRHILQEYLDQDLITTEEVFLKQLEFFSKNPKLYKLFKLQCADLLVLEEMEWNGIKYDFEKAKLESEKCKKRINEILSELQKGYEDIPIDWNSRDHLSCFLYGGTIIHEARLPVGVYMSGEKCGLPRFKILRTPFELPKLVDPIPNSNLKKQGYFSTSEEVLQQLKTKKAVATKINLLLEKAELEKLVNTYYDGLEKLREQQEWTEYLHGQFNQVVAATGRLSSSKPNQQNFAEQIKQLIITRYG